MAENPRFPEIENSSGQRVVIIKGSPGDADYVKKITDELDKFGMVYDGNRTGSVHRNVLEVIDILDQYKDSKETLAFVTVAGLSDGLSGVTKGYLDLVRPLTLVIACPPPDPEHQNLNYWSSLLLPSGIDIPVFINPKNGAYFLVEQFARDNPELANRYLEFQIQSRERITKADHKPEK